MHDCGCFKSQDIVTPMAVRKLITTPQIDEQLNVSTPQSAVIVHSSQMEERNGARMLHPEGFQPCFDSAKHIIANIFVILVVVACMSFCFKIKYTKINLSLLTRTQCRLVERERPLRATSQVSEAESFPFICLLHPRPARPVALVVNSVAVGLCVFCVRLCFVLSL